MIGMGRNLLSLLLDYKILVRLLFRGRGRLKFLRMYIYPASQKAIRSSHVVCEIEERMTNLPFEFNLL